MLLKLSNLKFDIYIGDTGNLATSENYLNFRWKNPDCNILFSATRRGNAVLSHLSSDKLGLRKLEQALNEWCEFCFYIYEWCEFIVGVIERPSIRRLAERCGFVYLADDKIGKRKIYIRRKS
jgi:hypothetical protein